MTTAIIAGSTALFVSILLGELTDMHIVLRVVAAMCAGVAVGLSHE